MNYQNFLNALNKTLKFEGGFTTGADQVSDTPTNMGITAKTLAHFNSVRPLANFPTDVRNLTRVHVTTIYYTLFWEQTNVARIQNERIRNAVFDMTVMSGINIAARTLQRALNEYLGVGLATDGIMGPRTIDAVNSVIYVDAFIDTLCKYRMMSLRQMKNWPTAKNGWTRRTNSY